MAQRVCSCCGQSYTDEDGHNLDNCIGACLSHLGELESMRVSAQRSLEGAYERKIAQLKEQCH